MRNFFILLFLTFFLSGLYIFCNHFGIGNTPSAPIPLEDIQLYLPGILVLSGVSAYVFLKIKKRIEVLLMIIR